MLGTTPTVYKSGNEACTVLTSMESRMRAASIKPKLVLRASFASRSDGWSTVGAEWEDTVVAVLVDARVVSVMDESASAMGGETCNTAGRVRMRRVREKKATTGGLC